LVSTPIGNLRDITLRALDVLAGADLVLAEDTRVTRRLLDAYEIDAKLQSYHDHNGEKIRPLVLQHLEDGARIALVSDAGTPLISDPGFKLAREVIAAGYEVTAIPGASAVLSALCVAGLPTDSFTFAGFPPPKAAARESWMQGFATARSTLVFYEGASRVPDCLASAAKVFGDRPAAVCRELTKLHEEARRGRLSELATDFAQTGAPRGEVVIVVGPPSEDGWDQDRIDTALSIALSEMRIKEASALVAEQSGWPRRDVYARALALKEDGR
jgi:16S rRNA (cytidine1402-2'-O)-methyltransferase